MQSEICISLLNLFAITLPIFTDYKIGSILYIYTLSSLHLLFPPSPSLPSLLRCLPVFSPTILSLSASSADTSFISSYWRLWLTICQTAPLTNLFPLHHLRTLINVHTQLPASSQSFCHSHLWTWLLSVFILVLFVYFVLCACYYSDVRNGYPFFPVGTHQNYRIAF